MEKLVDHSLGRNLRKFRNEQKPYKVLSHPAVVAVQQEVQNRREIAMRIAEVYESLDIDLGQAFLQETQRLLRYF